MSFIEKKIKYVLDLINSDLYRFSLWFTVCFFTTFTVLGLLHQLPIFDFSLKNNTIVKAEAKEDLSPSVFPEASIVNSGAMVTPSPQSSLVRPQRSSVAVKPEKPLPAGFEAPLRIVISKIGIDIAVVNPTGKDVASLDAALKKGVARYPDSAYLGEKGNVFLLGHSSHLAVVYNKAYRAFNEIQSLDEGDEVTVYSKSAAYIYKVVKVTEKKESEAVINLFSKTPKLTLVTCNNFGGKEDRFIVEAELIEVRGL